MNCDFIKSQVFKDTLLQKDSDGEHRPDGSNMTGHDRVVSRFNMYYRQQAAASFSHARTQLYSQAIRQYHNAMSQGFPFHGFELVQTFEPHTAKNPSSAFTMTGTSIREAPMAVPTGPAIHGIWNAGTSSG